MRSERFPDLEFSRGASNAAADADAGSWAASWSVAKSFASSLVGIAIDEGLIPGVDVSMADYLPTWKGTEKEAITLRHVLQMTPGLQWNESYDPNDAASSDVIQLVLDSQDSLALAASSGVAATPGSVFNYSSGTAMLLSGVRNGTYVKYDGEPVADPNLFVRVPNDGLVPGLGTLPPDEWSDTDFLLPILDSIGQ